jgi:hypothetical protein
MVAAARRPILDGASRTGEEEAMKKKPISMPAKEAPPRRALAAAALTAVAGAAPTLPLPPP